MRMETITKEVIDNIGECKKLVVKQMCDEDFIMSMNSDALKALQLCLGLIDDASRLMEEYSRVLDEQNRKLDMILEKLEDKA